MATTEKLLRTIADERARDILRELHRRAGRQNFSFLRRFAAYVPRLLWGRALPWERIEPRMEDLFLAIDPASGVFCYLLARALQARRVVEFGTSFGVSTIYLALAVRDNGGGQVIGSEMVPAKAARAREHLRAAGLADLVEIREGDALQTLADVGGPVDLLLNDGFPRFVLPVLQRVAPHMRRGAVALCGNAALFPADHADYLTWVRDPAHGFCSGTLATTLGGEFSVKLA